MNTNKVYKIERKQERWSKRIIESHSASVGSIIRTGQLLIDAKADCDHGEWGELTGQTTGKPMLPFSYRTAQRYMTIARHPCLSNATTWSHLPVSWRALYELSKLEESVLERNIKNGEITPDLTVNGAITLCKLEKVRFHYTRTMEAFTNWYENTVQTGQLLIDAKADCDHGEWGEVKAAFPKAKECMAIAEHPVLSNPDMWHMGLPQDIEVLYELSKLDSSFIELCIDNGSIFFEMELDDVNALCAG